MGNPPTNELCISLYVINNKTFHILCIYLIYSIPIFKKLFYYKGTFLCKQISHNDNLHLCLQSVTQWLSETIFMLS